MSISKSSEHFSTNELKCKCGCNTIKINSQLLYALEVLRRLIKKPIIITSAYRCPAHNKAIGGVESSQHIQGNAADIIVKNMSPNDVAKIAEGIFDGIGYYDTFTHVDVRGYKARWGNNILPNGPTEDEINEKLKSIEK